MIRLFAALPVPPAMADRLESLARGLPGHVQPREALHLTLAFFGELDEPRAADLHAALGAVSAPAFAWRLDGVGAFGGDRPHALYAAVRPDPALDHLRAKVAQAARLAGVAVPAGRWTPHVTLSRMRPGAVSASAAARALADRAAFLAGPAQAAAFSLMRSDPGHGGPRYAALADYALADAAA